MQRIAETFLGSVLRLRHFLRRRVFVLNGSWDFAFLGDISIDPQLAVAEAGESWSQADCPERF